uniref:Uncharacterized protein n=1 Tax=Panagrolaimus superbus TaxID=310955 RepID=A0A914YPN3_9BILA
MSNDFVPINFSANEGYFALISATSDLLTVMAYGFKSKSLITHFDVTADKAMTFLDSVADIFDAVQCKAIILHIFYFKPTGFPHVMIFARELRRKLADNKLCNFFYSGKNLFISGMLISAKIKSIKNDSLICIWVKPEQLLVMEYLFTDMGYNLIRENVIEKASERSNCYLRLNILHLTKPKHIVVYAENLETPFMKELKKKVFCEEKIHLLDKRILKESILQSKKIAKFVRDRSIVKYHINAKCEKDFAVYLDDIKNPLFVVKAGESLPVKVVDCVRRGAEKLLVCSFDVDTNEKRIIFIHKLEDNQNCHRQRITFFVDKENFPSIQSVPIILDAIKQFPQKLDGIYSKKMPVIIFRDTYSLICAVKSGNKFYSYLDGWNDMLEIMAQEDLSTLDDPVFSKNYFRENESFNRNYDRQDIVCFFMTKFLEEHLKVIKDETGESDEIAFCLAFPENENKIFRQRLLKSLKDLKTIFHLLPRGLFNK